MSNTRRNFLQSAALAAGFTGTASSLMAQATAPQQGRGARGTPPREGTLADLKGHPPQGQIGKLKISRMIIGGNPIGGWAHSRDLAYVGRLMKAYWTQAKINETLALAEKCGINTLLGSYTLLPSFAEYWRSGGKIQLISDHTATSEAELMDAIQMSIDLGASAGYVNGMSSDAFVQKGDFDTISKGLELIRKNGLPAGIGGHKIGTIKACVAHGLSPDFWMKTFHRTDYWSAKVEPQRDNIFDEHPEETMAFMKDLKEPWIAFKTLAAGAIAPKVGFPYAFQNGADFICVGMFDWQVVDNVNTLLETLAGVPPNRERPWRA